MNKYFNLITYKNGNVVDMIPFNEVEEVNNLLSGKDIDKIRLFKLNKAEDGRDLIKELYISDINDFLIKEEGTNIIGYNLSQEQGHIYFDLKYQVSKEVKELNELCHNKRYISTLLYKSKFNNDTFRDGLSAALI